MDGQGKPALEETPRFRLHDKKEPANEKVGRRSLPSRGRGTGPKERSDSSVSRMEKKAVVGIKEK